MSFPTHSYNMNTITTSSNFKPKSDTIILLDRPKSQLVTVARAAIMHMPAKPTQTAGSPTTKQESEKYPEICEEFHALYPGSCSDENCPHVHAYLEGCPRKTVHISWAWRSLDECQYERYPAGQRVVVREPVSAKSDIVDAVDSSYVLKTRCVFNDLNRPPTHCAHFYYGRECHIGQRCDFAHVVHVNAKAEKVERAKPPAAFGRTRNTDSPGVSTPTSSVLKVEKKHLPDVSPTSNGNMMSFPGSPRSFHSPCMTPPPAAYLSSLLSTCFASPTTPFPSAGRKTPLPSTPALREAEIERNPKYHDILSAEPPVALRQRSATAQPTRWRHDPYSMVTVKVIATTPKPQKMAREEEDEAGFFSPSWFGYFNTESEAENEPVPFLHNLA